MITDSKINIYLLSKFYTTLDEITLIHVIYQYMYLKLLVWVLVL